MASVSHKMLFEGDSLPETKVWVPHRLDRFRGCVGAVDSAPSL